MPKIAENCDEWESLSQQKLYFSAINVKFLNLVTAGKRPEITS